MKNIEKIVLQGTFGDKEVRLCQCFPENPNGTSIILLHGVHSSANLEKHNKFSLLAEFLTDRGFTAWIVETSRKVRDRYSYGDDISSWIKDAFCGKTYIQEEEDAFIAMRHILLLSENLSFWVWGFSLGGIIALSAASGKIFGERGHCPFECVILGGTGLVSMPKVEENMPKLPILSTLREVVSSDLVDYVAPNIFISFRGSKDDVFSKNACLDLLNRIKTKDENKYFYVIDGADHGMIYRNGTRDPDIMREMADFIAKVRIGTM